MSPDAKIFRAGTCWDLLPDHHLVGRQVVTRNGEEKVVRRVLEMRDNGFGEVAVLEGDRADAIFSWSLRDIEEVSAVEARDALTRAKDLASESAPPPGETAERGVRVGRRPAPKKGRGCDEQDTPSLFG